MNIVIIGAGHAAAQCVMNLRREGVEDKIIMVGDESVVPYMRPPLSKAFLQDKQSKEQLLIKPESFYEENNVEWQQARVNEIQEPAKQVVLDDGKVLDYGKLIIAIGAKLRKLDVEGSDLEGIHYLKTLADAESIKAQMQTAKKIVICGGGYIGLEVAASAKQLGLDVTVIEMGERVMQRAVSEYTSTYFSQLHADKGVNILCSKTLSHFNGEGKLVSAACTDGSEYDAELVVVGIGVIPETALAESAGIACENGIVVNEYCQTNFEDIYAIGDCANHFNQIYQKQLRLECVQNANGQAKTVAAHIAGKELPYNELPWFWSDQYDKKLQMAGFIDEVHDEIVVRKDNEADESFAVFVLKDNVIISAETVKRPKDFIAAKTLIAKKVKVDVDQLSNTSIELSSLT